MEIYFVIPAVYLLDSVHCIVAQTVKRLSDIEQYGNFKSTWLDTVQPERH